MKKQEKGSIQVSSSNNHNHNNINTSITAAAEPKIKKRNERTLVLIKPDAVQRSLIGELIRRFETRGLKLVALKFEQATESKLRMHYSDLAARSFYTRLIDYMRIAPIVPMVWEGVGVVRAIRAMIGETSPGHSKPGTIRGDFALQTGRNLIHASDSVDSAKREIALWFKPEELQTYQSNQFDLVHEK